MMHISIAYSLCFEDENANIFKSLPRDKFDAIRASTILLVLATDMTQHFAKLGKLKARLQTCKDNQTQFPEAGKKEDKELLMENIIHACDISNPAQRTSIAKMQIGFISFVVTPLYTALGDVIDMAAEPV